MIEPYASKAERNLVKARGLVDTVLRMKTEGRYCMDLIQQCNAAIGMLQQANNLILESHLHSCGETLKSKDAKEKQRFITELLRVFNVSQRKG